MLSDASLLRSNIVVPEMPVVKLSSAAISVAFASGVLRKNTYGNGDAVSRACRQKRVQLTKLTAA